MAIEGVLDIETMKSVIQNGGSVLFHPRNAAGEVNGLGSPITNIEDLPTKAQLGKAFGDAATTDAHKNDLETKVAELQAELASMSGEVPVSTENADDLIAKFQADPNSLKWGELRAVAAKVGLEKFGQTPKDELIEQIKAKVQPTE